MRRALCFCATAILGLWLVGCQPAGFGDTSFEGECVAVRDGDTIEVERGKTTVRVRLHGIDTPEKTQPFSGVARRRTTELVEHRRVRVEVRDRDRYDRLVARVYVDGDDLSLQLVKEGLAWHYRHYSSDPRLAFFELRARQRRLGLWQDRNPEPPWEFRRRRRQER